MSVSLKMGPSSRSLFLLALAACPVFCRSAQAQTTIQVPSNFPTIQSAVNAANDGDTVLVAPGTYVENINFNGKAITVTSSGGPAVTIIDGNHNGTVVTFNHSETAASVLSGFTVQNGFQSGGFGAGITITSASPTISSNVITGNHSAVAIGIYVNGGSPLISKNTITNNDQTGAGDGGIGGGGIAVSGTSTSASNPLILNNVITNNSVAAGGDGGGISVTYFSSPVIQGNLIRGNSAYNNGGGVSLNSYNSPVLSNNLIVNNDAGGGGSGGGLSVFARNSATVTVVNNTVAANTAFDGSSGIFTTGLAQYATLANNVVVASAAQTAVTCNTLWSSVSAVFSHNDVYSPTGTGYSGPCDTTSNPGNVSADPLFLSASNNDYHLAVSSPAVDAGDNSAPNLPATDFDGNPRIADGNGDGTSVVDLGAFEVTPTSAASPNPNTLTFGRESVGSTSAAQTVTLVSTGSTAFQISSVQAAGDFAQTSNCPVLAFPGVGGGIAAGSSCAFNVTFTPTATGVRTGSLTVNGTNGVSVVVPLTGAGGTVPQLSLSPTSLSFAGQAVGSPGVPQLITLTNTGGASFYFTYINSSSSSFVQTNNCGTSLSTGASCTISVVFVPSSANFFSGQIDIYDGLDTLSYSVPLSGTGIDFYLSSSGSASLVAGYSGQFPVTVNALGGSTYPYSVTLSCSGMPAYTTCGFSPATTQAAFSSQTLNMNVSAQFLAPGGTYPLTITAVSGNGYAHTQVFPLTIVKPSIGVSPSSLIFAALPVGTRSIASSVTITSAGTGIFNFSSIATSGPFIQTNNCHSTLPNYASCTVSVTFAPTAYGQASGTLSILDNVDGLAYSVPLTGTGTDFSVSTSVPSVSVVRGSGTSLIVNVGSLGAPFQNSVSLACSGIPGKISCAFSPVSVTPGANGGSSNLTISLDQSAVQTGTYTIAIVGTSGSFDPSDAVTTNHCQQTLVTIHVPKAPKAQTRTGKDEEIPAFTLTA